MDLHALRDVPREQVAQLHRRALAKLGFPYLAHQLMLAKIVGKFCAGWAATALQDDARRSLQLHTCKGESTAADRMCGGSDAQRSADQPVHSGCTVGGEKVDLEWNQLRRRVVLQTFEAGHDLWSRSGHDLV
jgi:hypothetical protein